MKEECEILKDAIKELVDIITNFEEDLTDDSFEESNSFVQDNHMIENTLEQKCFICDFVANKELSLNKHMTTKHESKSDQLANQKEIDAIETVCSFEGIEVIEDMFQLEIVEDEQVFACNICNEGFDKHNEVKKHIENYHKVIIIQIRRNLDG